jgi:SnoaL-like domain
MTTEKTLEIVHAYYDGWQGAGAYDEARIRALLAPNLGFESPVNERRGADSFMVGLGGFVTTVKSRRMLQIVAAGDEAAALYDCELTRPVNTLRCAEFFRVVGNRIESIRLLFDATAYRKNL